MRKFHWTWTFIASLLLATTAIGKEASSPSQSSGEQPQYESDKKSGMPDQARMKTGLISANRLIGQNVENTQGELLGEISNIIIDSRNNQAAYVEVTFGGVLGVGEAERAVPFETLQKTDEGYVLDLSKDSLSQVPQWQPGMSGEDFGRRIYKFFGQAPYWEKYGPGDQPGLRTPRKQQE